MQIRPVLSLSILSILAAAPAALAIKGTYLPESELSKSTCKIKVGRALTIYTPTLQNGTPNGLPVFRDEVRDVSMCSATLVAPNTIFTAAHCFVGNNEQLVQKGTFLYPNLDINGNLVPGCTRDDWFKKEACIAGKVFGTVKSKWENLELECPTLDGKTESRPLSEATGYPNPLFRADASVEQMTMRNYDFAIWRVEQPFARTPVMQPELEWKNVLAALKQKAGGCRSFGYGRDNEEKSGILHGARTPVTAATERLLMSDLVPGDDGVVIDGGRVDHGDSGGTLACEALDGTTKLFGVVSRGGEDIAPMSDVRTEIGIYSMPSYNASWIRKVLQEAPIKRDLSTQWWYNFTVKYHQEVLEESLRAAKSCIDENRREMGREVYRNFYLPAYSDIQNKYVAYQREASRYPDGAGLLRAHMRELVDLANRLLMDCQARHF